MSNIWVVLVHSLRFRFGCCLLRVWLHSLHALGLALLITVVVVRALVVFPLRARFLPSFF